MVFVPGDDELAEMEMFDFQFPVGIRWCSDSRFIPALGPTLPTFNSLWELDGVRTTKY